MDNPNLEQQLIEIGYRNLFLFGSKGKAEDLWQNGKNKQALMTIVTDENSSDLGRFLAAEILFRNDISPNEAYFPLLAKSYAFALENTSYEAENPIGINGNSWGFLYQMDDPGLLGKRFLVFGKNAKPHLEKLLNNKNGSILYEGSEDATIGNAYQYRIKDFAAFYLHKITDAPIQFYPEIGKRDAEILRFKNSIVLK